ncbi:putative phage abortive infection protein [Flavobacterium sp. JAS]|uniref:putative phage abortive infection protein n=1 Tax=Flavobacterium sp. JAS TaxID=2897329 RepID=UPI001E5C817C|nr:putative phage abortive infection protein [Flavobacterium sp. JAS]MCD0472498.1 putative phage abortive infection protein [Flavobacterium sp. JAS]
MKTSEKEKFTLVEQLKFSRNLSFYFIGISIIGFVILMAPFILDLSNISKYGNVGDAVGGLLNPVVGIGVGFLTFMAFIVQYQANQQVRDQFEQQSEIDYRQNFESTFFNLLSLHHQIVQNFDFDPQSLKLDTNLINYISKYDRFDNITAVINSSQTLGSRDVFKFSLELLHQLLQDDINLLVPLHKNKTQDRVLINLIKHQNRQINLEFNAINNFIKDTIISDSKSVTTRFQSIYDFVYFKFNSDYGHYYRNLYRMVKMVDERKFSKDATIDFEIKYSYTSILRAQLSDNEIAWLYFNCISDKGIEKFKPLLEKYSFFKIINRNAIVYKLYSRLYNQQAFRKINNSSPA